MTSTAIAVPKDASGDVVAGHDYPGRPVPPTDLGAIAGAGALRASVTDMLRFADANLDDDGDELRQAMTIARAPRRSTGAPKERIGLNWITDRLAQRAIVWHNGATNGFYSFIGLDEARKTAIVVLSNSRKEAVDDIGFHMLDRRVSLLPAPKPPREIALPASVLRRYVGVYDIPGVAITITRGRGGLWASFPGQPTVRLYAQTTTRFFLKAFDARVSFKLGRGGRVIGIDVDLNDLPVSGVRRR
jgi:CubicO group peptidase (beta-lactamase class C family)